jgi:plasmid stabilization system protein ParE
MRKVILSRGAAVQLEKLLDYLESQWSEKAKMDFIKKLDKALATLKKYPESSEKSHIKQGLYRCVVSRQTIIFYQFDASTISIVALFDTRMDPDKIHPEI